MHKDSKQLLKKNPSKLKYLLEDERQENPQDPEPLYYLARVFLKEGKIQKAIQAYKKCLDLNPKHKNALLGLCILYNDLGFYEEAKKLFKTIENLDKDSSEKSLWNDTLQESFVQKHLQLAKEYLSYHQEDEALLECDRALKVKKNHLEILLLKSEILMSQKRFKEALDLLLKAKKNHHQNLEVRLLLAFLYLDQGKALEAEEELTFILLKESNHQQAKKMLMKVQQMAETTLN